MVFCRLFAIGALLLTFISPVRAQEPGSILPTPKTFQQDVYTLNVPLKRVDHDTQDVDLIPYTDYASAAASHCQVFKEQGQNLWWANCGVPIEGFTVVSNLDGN